MQKYGNLSPPPSPSPVKGEEIFDFLRDHQEWKNGMMGKDVTGCGFKKQRSRLKDQGPRKKVKNRNLKYWYKEARKPGMME
jgi:hypothetical protein